jgi:hypothetical protein
MKIEKIRAVTERYNCRINELEQAGCLKGNSHHVLFNLICGLGMATDFLEDYPERAKWEDRRSNYLENLRRIKTYFRLLDNHPKFKEAEFNIDLGYFPDIADSIPASDYVDESKRRLKDK